MTQEFKQLQRKTLGFSPTPIKELDNLSQHLNGPRILIKRDGLTGLAFGIQGGMHCSHIQLRLNPVGENK